MPWERWGERGNTDCWWPDAVTILMFFVIQIPSKVASPLSHSGDCWSHNFLVSNFYIFIIFINSMIPFYQNQFQSECILRHRLWGNHHLGLRCFDVSSNSSHESWGTAPRHLRCDSVDEELTEMDHIQIKLDLSFSPSARVFLWCSAPSEWTEYLL